LGDSGFLLITLFFSGRLRFMKINGRNEGEGRDGSRECLKSSGSGGGGSSSVVATSLHRIYPTRNDLLFTFYEPLGMPRHIGRRTETDVTASGWLGRNRVAALGLPRCPVGRILGRLFGRLI
jgi:hypothetical protein